MAHRYSFTSTSEELSAPLLAHQTLLGESDNGKEKEEPHHIVLDVVDESNDQTHSRKIDNGKTVDKPAFQDPPECNLYKPSLVSIGPKYSEEVDKIKNNEYKKIYYESFLKKKVGQSKTTEMHEEEYLKCLKDPWMQLKTKEYYKGIGITCPSNDEEFVEMLLIDGCFVVEFVLKCKEGSDDDPRLSVDGKKARMDMLLFENQLPFDVLTALYDKKTGRDPKARPPTRDPKAPSFIRLVKFTFASLAPNFTLSNLFNDGKPENPKDILHVVYSLCLPSKAPEESHGIFRGCFRRHVDDANRLALQHINSATELREVGIRFKSTGKVYTVPRKYEKISLFKKRNSTNLFDIHFSGRGAMRIPCFKVDGSTEIFFRIMIAFEQRHRLKPKYYTDYAWLMGQLVGRNEDVTLLRKTGAIHNLLRDDQKVANMFNKVGVDDNKYASTHSHFAPVYIAVSKHFRNKGHEWMTKLTNDYFPNPWKGISTVAAIIIAALTVKSYLNFN